MVTTATYIEVYCDHCGEYMNDYDSGESAWKSRDEARATMKTLDWVEHPNGECLCPRCFEKAEFKSSDLWRP